MKLVIAEKKSLGQAIAEHLGGTNKSVGGYIENSQGYIVTWCAGHFYEMAPPGYYLNGNKGFSFEALPILPQQWKVLPKQDAQGQLGVIRNLLKKATSVIHAGDPDREGQLIVDELLEDMNCKLPVQRLWLNAYDKTSVQRALANLKDNKEFLSWGYAAKARQRADWLVGMNLSPAFTLAARRSGFMGTLSVGRVQTPTLSLVSKRCIEIETFVPQDYYSMVADVKVAAGTFTANLRVDKNMPGVVEGRVSTRQLADAIIQRVTSTPGRIAKCKTDRISEAPPLGFNATSLSALAIKRFGYSGKLVEQTLQELYDPKLALTTYPRTDSEYLPESQHADAAQILGHLAANFPAAAKADATRKGKWFNDKKVTAHHAIVPTLQQANLALLTAAQKNIYELICMRYIAAFYPDFVYDKTSVEVEFAGTVAKDVFTASGRIELQQGWRDVLQIAAKKGDDEAQLPKIVEGEPAQAVSVTAKTKKTEPPPYYTEGTLRETMANVHTEVSDPEIKKRLKEVAGIGTEATRARIIEILFNREFIRTDKKFIKDTPTGRDLVKAVPVMIKDPGMTALWESSLESIKEGGMEIDAFLQMQSRAIVKIIDFAREAKIEVASTKSQLSKNEKKKDCPKCGKPMVQRTAKTGKSAGKKFLGCTGYPECNHSEWENTTRSAGKGNGKSYSKGYGGTTTKPGLKRTTGTSATMGGREQRT